MVKTIYLGNNVGGITGMPVKYTGNLANYSSKEEEFTNLEQFLKSAEVGKFQYLFAITANKFQNKSAGALKNNGFRPVTEFYSSHDVKDETLTIWTKTNGLKDKEFKDLLGLAVGPNYGNCSVGYDRNSYERCIVTSKGPADTLNSLKNLGFKRVKNTNIFFKINDKHLVKKE